MNITIFTADNLRHNYLIKLMAESANKLFVVKESLPTLSGNKNDSKIINEYFEMVNYSQIKIFDINSKIKKEDNIETHIIKPNEINNLKLSSIRDYLSSDIYIVFGSSYIKGELVDFLIKNKAINIHMGISPYYRGTDCNFWALFDERPHLVGATIHYLSKGLDSGEILYHAMSRSKQNPFDYTMSTVKSAFHSLSKHIKDKNIFDILPTKQDKNKELRYSRNEDFNEEVLKVFLRKNINLKNIPFDQNLLINPYFL